MQTDITQPGIRPPEFSLPTLYKKSAGGKLQQWSIFVCKCYDDAYDIITTHGQVDGKMQTATEVIVEGKNIGKANETSVEEQAISEAKSKWELQKKKKGYVESIEAANAGEVDALVEGGIFPMLAQKFEKQAHKVTYPAFIQPKFDGHRCIGIVKDGVCTLWSRTRKRINTMPHIEKAIIVLSRGRDAIFDGELYNHEYHANFEKITSLIRPKAPVEGYEKVKFYIYDMPSAELPFEGRNQVINALFSRLPEDAQAALVEVETHRIDAEEEAALAFDRFFGLGYEGAMLRTADNKYLSHPTSRSPGLLKLKRFDDAEFEIVDVIEGTGKMAGKAIFICRAGNGEAFNAVKNGPLSELKEYWENREHLIGRIVTVQFQGFTKANNVPRFPRVLRFREDL